MSYTIDSDVLNELQEITEDSVSYFCDQHMVSGELAWICIQALATAKIAQMQGLVD